MPEKLVTNGVIPAEDLYFLLNGKEKIHVLDATYAVMGGQKSPLQAFMEARIENAQFFDIDVVADQAAALPHTLPSPEYFESCVSAMGISNDDHVVIYDQSGSYMAASRAWWMFRVFGHVNVYVLEGGLKAWEDRGFKVVSGAPDAPAMTSFKATYNPSLVVTKEDLLKNLETDEAIVLDARPPIRFNGEGPEPRSGMRAGHIPKSLNMPFSELLDGKSRFLKDASVLDQAFANMDVTKDSKVAVSCGSGVTACMVSLALYKARRQDSAVYDGSWTEWGDEKSDTPVEVSA